MAGNSNGRSTILLILLSILFVQISLGVEQQAPSEKTEVDQLLTIIRDKTLQQTEPKRVIQAIIKLGELRAPAAINDLVLLLTYKQTFEWESSDARVEVQPIYTGNRYPATDALFQIGKPALPSLLRVIQDNETNSLMSKNALYTIEQIFRNKRSDGVEYLRSAAAASASSLGRKRLSSAAEKADDLAKKLAKH